MITLIPVWLATAILVGFFGRHYRFGFWGYFFVSIFLTPIIGLLMLIAAEPKRERKSGAARHS
jgi:hypothetical protein